MFDWIKKTFKKKKSEPKKEAQQKTNFKEEKSLPEILESKQENVIVDEFEDLYSIPETDIATTPSPKTLLEQLLEDIEKVEVIDLRHEQTDPPELVDGKKKWKTHNGRVFKRDPKKITGIVVHQTAARFGVSGNALKASGGDRRLALARRSKGISCHMMAFADGFVAWPHPLNWYTYHGNDFNSTTLGFEIDGDFAGLADDPTTAFRKKDNPDVLDPKLKAAACRVIKEFVERGREEGMDIKYIYAHRQSSPTRRSDPGEQIWKEVVLGYAVPVLGLEVRPAHIQKVGYTIPKEWDEENGVGKYWDNPKTK